MNLLEGDGGFVVIIVMMMQSHKQFVEQLQHFIVELNLIERIVVEKSSLKKKKKGF